MIAGALAARADRHPEREWIHRSAGSLCYAACQREVERLAHELRACARARVGLRGTTAEWLLPRLFALDGLGARAYLLPSDGAAGRAESQAATLGLRAILSEPAASGTDFQTTTPAESTGEVVIFTSGTTGTPKPVPHSWGALASRVLVRPGLDAPRWLLTYGLSTFAGLQVFLHALLNGGTLISGEGGPAELARLAREAGATHASGTPSFFRLLLSLAPPADLESSSLKQITLGGEAVDQALLDALRQRFPATRVTQIYASTELGVCFSVHDGRAGFPAAYLDDAGPGVRLRIVDGELHIGPAAAAVEHGQIDTAAASTPFFATGDLVERRGDRVVFLGRRCERINVGGHKAFPAEIEAAVLEVPGVRAARVSGVPSSLVGQLVRAEVILDGAADAAATRRRILEHCRLRLRPHLVPRMIEFVSELAWTDSRKLRR